MSYSFITDKIIQTLRDNHDNTDFATESIADKPVVVKFFNPYGRGDWWAYSMDKNNRLFGIADIFEPEYGLFDLSDERKKRNATWIITINNKPSLIKN